MTEERIDKSTWGDGPWQEEPDRLEWRHARFPCLMIRQRYSGNWCGYVGVPPGHPLHGKHYEDPDVSVHGGLTYSDACQEDGHICHVAQPGEPEHVWWFGFDCNHAFDYAPGMAARMREFGHYSAEDAYRDLAYVQAETNRLAEQLSQPKGGT
jgi:hypothetical protein